uniref:Uncharacterized protein n=1 Tax=Pithovirus LCPAC403 TaxID=2506596 RepID=A0A481ZCQ5_9VIRU|nr:MAG: uncharacterized protein LCPAC403_03890 [Pithovirus LCPAC403]
MKQKMWDAYYRHRDLMIKCQQSYKGSYSTDEFFMFIWNYEKLTDKEKVGALSYYVTRSIHFKGVGVERKEELYSFLLDKLYSFLLDKLDDTFSKGKLYTYYLERVLSLITIDKSEVYGNRLYYEDPKSGYLPGMLQEIKSEFNKRRLSIYAYEFFVNRIETMLKELE